MTITGLAFLLEDGVQKSLSKFVEEFKHTLRGDSLHDVSSAADSFHSFLDSKYKEQLKGLPDQIRQDLSRQGLQVIELVQHPERVTFKFKNPSGKEQQGSVDVDRINFIIAGFNSDGSHEVLVATVPGKIEQRRSSAKKTLEYGTDWIGQIDVVSRIILGFDHRIATVPFVKDAMEKSGEAAAFGQLRALEYVIQWGTMTLKDAVDFCMLAINTTAAIQRFSDGILASPGEIPGVGGPIDVAVITPEKGFEWVARKQLKSL